MLEELIERTLAVSNLQARPRELVAPAPSLVLGLYVLLTFHTVGAVFKDSVLREQGVVLRGLCMCPINF